MAAVVKNNRENIFYGFFKNGKTMKFCKKCHKRVVEKIESNVDLSVCMCGNQPILIHNTVVKRLGSEMGVCGMKKLVF